jgi:hypothetical protein
VDLRGERRGFIAKPFRKSDLLRKTKELLAMEPALLGSNHAMRQASAGPVTKGMSH